MFTKKTSYGNKIYADVSHDGSADWNYKWSKDNIIILNKKCSFNFKKHS